MREMDAEEKKEKALKLQLEAEMAEKDKKKPTTVKVTKKAENSDEEENKQQTALEAVDGWSIEQQKQMEDGMKQIPASVPAKQRWV